MGLWLHQSALVLASRSSIRRAILQNAGIPVETSPADLDERAVEAQCDGLEPARLSILLAREKAREVAGKSPGRLVVGGDQILTCEGERFSKPRDPAGARDQLRTLSGRTHELTSAAVLVRDQAVLFETVDIAHMTMRVFSAPFLDSYLEAAGEAVTASVGAYQLEGLGIQLFERIEGSYFTVLGLPMLPLLAFFRDQGWLAA